MKILHRYITQHFLMQFGLLFALLLIVLWIIQSLRFIDIIASGTAPLQESLTIVFSIIFGQFIPNTIPLLVFLSSLSTLHKFLDNYEITAWNALTVSPWRIIQPILVASLALMILNLFLSFSWGPRLFYHAQVVRAQITQSLLIEQLNPNHFYNLDSNIGFYFQSKNALGELRNLFFIESDNNGKLISYFHAEKANILFTDAENPKEPSLFLQNVHIFQNNLETELLETTAFSPSLLVRYQEFFRQKDSIPHRSIRGTTLKELFLTWQGDRDKYYKEINLPHSFQDKSTHLTLSRMVERTRTNFMKELTARSLFPALSLLFVFLAGWVYLKAAGAIRRSYALRLFVAWCIVALSYFSVSTLSEMRNSDAWFYLYIFMGAMLCFLLMATIFLRNKPWLYPSKTKETISL